MNSNISLRLHTKCNQLILIPKHITKFSKPGGPGVYAGASISSPPPPPAPETLDRNIEAAKASYEKLSDDEIKLFLHFLTDRLSPENLGFLAYLVAKTSQQSVKAAATSLRGQYKMIENLSKHNSLHCVENADQVLVCFIKAVSGLEVISDKKQLYHLARVMRV